MFEFKEEQINHSLWVEKYRPSKLDDYVGNEHLKSKVSGYIENEDVPHLLFFGKAGTGKTIVMNALMAALELLDRAYCVRKAAFMGTAANQMNGSTIHSLLKFTKSRIRRNNSVTTAALEHSWQDVNLLIIDEISTVR